jgi:3-oxoadipate enol-lactonase/4-carboxymuconolactone decarboxylase
MTTLVLAPSVGTSAAACWGPAVALLPEELDVVTWELPGHGCDRGPAPAGLVVGDLVARVLDLVDGPFVYAGDSVGGQVGLQLLLDATDRVLGAVLQHGRLVVLDDVAHQAPAEAPEQVARIIHELVQEVSA